MPKKTLSKAEGKRLLEETKQRLRLQQEARTIARIEQLDIEACERLGRQLQLANAARAGWEDSSILKRLQRKPTLRVQQTMLTTMLTCPGGGQ